MCASCAHDIQCHEFLTCATVWRYDATKTIIQYSLADLKTAYILQAKRGSACDTAMATRRRGSHEAGMYKEGKQKVQRGLIMIAGPGKGCIVLVDARVIQLCAVLYLMG